MDQARLRQWCIEKGIPPRKKYSPRLKVSAWIAAYVRRVWSKNPDRAEAAVRKFYKGREDLIYTRLFWSLRPLNRKASDVYAMKAIGAGSTDIEALKVYVWESYRSGNLTGLDVKSKPLHKTPRFKKLLKNIESSKTLLERGYPMPEAFPDAPLKSEPKRLFYLLHNSLPINSGGYATRSHGLLRGMKAGGYDPFAVTRLGFPHDRGKAYKGTKHPDLSFVDDISYVRLLSETEGLGKIPMTRYLKRNIEAHAPLVRAFQPEIIHGASNFINGVTANAVAHRFGLKSIYEVRGLWEITRLSREPEYGNTDAFNLYVRMETETCQNADHVFILTEALKREMASRGVNPDKMTVVPNGVDTKRFVPVSSDFELKRSLGFDDDDVIIGYIGSVVDYEGVDDLLRALAHLKAVGVTRAKLLIVGDGAVLESCKSLAEELNLMDVVRFTGRVPHSEVERYYSFVDIAPFPRKPLPVCEMVSPLKPFEAMAMGKAVLMSDVAAMAEIVENDKTGLLFRKADLEALTETLRRLVEDDALRRRLGAQARTFVTAEHDWSIIAQRMTNVYDFIRDIPAR